MLPEATNAAADSLQQRSPFVTPLAGSVVQSVMHYLVLNNRPIRGSLPVNPSLPLVEASASVSNQATIAVPSRQEVRAVPNSIVSSKELLIPARLSDIEEHVLIRIW